MYFLSRYLPSVTASLNSNYIYGTTTITPSKAQHNKNKYDVLIREIRKKQNRATAPLSPEKQAKVIRAYLRSKKSKNKRPGNLVYLNFSPSQSTMSKSYDFQVLNFLKF